jgi:phosphoribosyl-ATP pyrophosphohydrolase/phosphoribosyl-AMP cyclohydrolase
MADLTADIRFDAQGLAPAIVQHTVSGQILMLAWMNAEALELTRQSKQAHFLSRSRGTLWRKGETSGNTLDVVDVRWDCDADAILISARPAGPTCHTGTSSCFFQPSCDDGPPGSVLDRVWRELVGRRERAAPEESYTRSLLNKGIGAVAAKIAEEQAELVAELESGSEDAIVHEATDLLFHVLVGLLARDVPVARVLAELDRRFGVSGHAEKAARQR